MKSQEKPYTECSKSPPNDRYLYDQFISLGYTYDHGNCYDLCYQMSCYERCSCYNLEFLPPPEAILNGSCLSTEQITCSQEEFNQFSKGSVKESCGDYCPLEVIFILIKKIIKIIS